MSADHRQKGDSGERKGWSLSARGTRISGKSGLVKHKDSWKDKRMDGRADGAATQPVPSHMYVLLEGSGTQHRAEDLS